MSDTESGENKKCAVCSSFEPQAWRKSMCRNCFHTLPEHSTDKDTTDKNTRNATPLSKINNAKKQDSKSPKTDKSKLELNLEKTESISKNTTSTEHPKENSNSNQSSAMAKKITCSVPIKQSDKLSPRSNQTAKSSTDNAPTDDLTFSLSGKPKEITIQTTGNKLKFSLSGTRTGGDENKTSPVVAGGKFEFILSKDKKRDLPSKYSDKLKLPLKKTFTEKKAIDLTPSGETDLKSPQLTPNRDKFNTPAPPASSSVKTHSPITPTSAKINIPVAGLKKENDVKRPDRSNDSAIKIPMTFEKKSAKDCEEKNVIPIMGVKKHEVKSKEKVSTFSSESETSPIKQSVIKIPVTVDKKVEKKSSIFDKFTPPSSTVKHTDEKSKKKPGTLALDHKSKFELTVSPRSESNKVQSSPPTSVSRTKHFSRYSNTEAASGEPDFSTNSSTAGNRTKGVISSITTDKEHSAGKCELFTEAVTKAEQPVLPKASRKEDAQPKETQVSSSQTPLSSVKSTDAINRDIEVKNSLTPNCLQVQEKERRNAENKEKKAKSKGDKKADVENSAKVFAENNLEKLKKQLLEMEARCQELEESNRVLSEKDRESGHSLQKQKDEFDNTIQSFEKQVSSLGKQSSQMESENNSLRLKLKELETQQTPPAGTVSANTETLQRELKECEVLCDDLDDENIQLKQEIQDLKNEMDEMYDSFQDQEASEFRELQKELDMTTKNCRVLQFKLRKAERKSQQIEGERIQCQEKLKMLQDQFKSADAREYIKTLEEEVRVAKQVSVRLHDELDSMEEKKQKSEEEARHLTELLEQSDKKQFRMEMLIDKQHDQVNDLKDELARATGKTDEIKERKLIFRPSFDSP